MSTYATSEEALLEVIRLYNGGATFSENNSSRGSFKVLNNTGVTSAAVLMKVGGSQYADNLGGGRGAHGKRQQRHRIGIVVFQARRQDDDGITYGDLTALTDALIGHIDRYQRLNNAANVKRAQVIEDTETRVQQTNAWMFQTVLVQVDTETTPSLVEGAQDKDPGYFPRNASSISGDKRPRSIRYPPTVLAMWSASAAIR